MNADGTTSQTQPGEHQPVETSASPHFNSQTKLIIFLLVVMIAPNISNFLDTTPTRPQDIYLFIPNWYTLWAVLNETLPAVALLAFLFIRKKSVLFAGFLVLLFVAIINIIVEISILKPIAPMALYPIRLTIIVLYIWILRYSWHRNASASEDFISRWYSRKPVLIKLLVLFILIGLLFGLNYQKNINASNYTPYEVTPTAGGATEWKTYTALDAAYSFEYPPDWSLETTSSPQGSADARLTFVSNGNNYVFAVTEREDFRGAIAREENQLVKYSGKLFTRRTLIEGGKVVYISISPYGHKMAFNHIEINLPPQETDKYLRIFDQILSTFKFP